MGEKEYLTQEKFEELQKELKYLQTTRRKEIAEQLEYARSLGDLSENAEYHEARDQQAKTEARILQLEHILKNAEILTHKKSNIAEVGSQVTIQKVGEKEKIMYTIVSSEETDASSNKISNHSPLGMSLLGKKRGETFEFKTPKGNIEYKVVEVN